MFKKICKYKTYLFILKIYIFVNFENKIIFHFFFFKEKHNIKKNKKKLEKVSEALSKFEEGKQEYKLSTKIYVTFETPRQTKIIRKYLKAGNCEEFRRLFCENSC